MTETYGFELLREQQIRELKTRARLYRHIQTGAQLLSLENDDENKVFGITFRTPATDSTGLPHIMEHSVLCGSRKYPVKEPFVELLKGSLNTFLNAMTFPDKTCYPVASQNIQDFYNLVDVYMDAVFFPLLSPYTLDQEGWHYELDDPQAPLAFKGVVFNEMKGVFSQPDSLLGEEIQQSLFPDNTYGFNSGGDPTEIPNLTYEQFRAYHDLYYHPSNALIYFYGDDEPERRLMLMNEYLRAFEAIPEQPEVALQPAYDAPRQVEAHYEVEADSPDAKSYVAVNWLLPEVGDAELTLGLVILEQVLIGTPAAQLRKALIDSGLGEDLTGAGLETGLRQMFFSTGLKGVARENAGPVEALILDKLSEMARQGVDRDNIAAALNTIEFRLRENNTGAYPRGLFILLRVLETWLYDKDPFAPLEFEAPLNAIRAKLGAGEPYFEHLIEAYLINNLHRTTVTLHPDPTLAEKRAAEEQQRLDQARGSLSEADLSAIVENTRTLKRRQETPDSPEALMTIPMLELDDLDRTVRQIPIEALEGGRGKILFHDLFTNGILYLDLGFDMRVLPQEYLPYMPLFGRALLETGSTAQSFVQLLQRIGRTTGGIRPAMLVSKVRKTGQAAAWFFLRGKAMVAQAGELLTIVQEVLSGANLENRERFRQMALEEKARVEARIMQGGHAVVNTRLRARFNEADWANEQMGGVSYLFFLRELTSRIDNDWPAVLQALQSIREQLITGSSCVMNITLDEASWQALRPQAQAFLSSLPVGSAQGADWALPALSPSEGLTIPTQVNFVGKGADLYGLGYGLDGSILAITNYLNSSWVWDKVRVQGGAYGGFCVFDTQSGVMTFLSYRDPNLAQTLEAYDGSAQFLKTVDMNDAELTKAIIGTIGELDSYLLPDAKGYMSMRYYLLGITDEERQAIRDQVLSTSAEDFRQLGEVLEQANRQGQVVVLGSAEAIEAAGILIDIQKVL